MSIFSKKPPAYKDPDAPLDNQKRDAVKAIGGYKGVYRSLRKAAAAKGNEYNDKNDRSKTQPHGVPIVKREQQNEMTAGAAGNMGYQLPLGSSNDDVKEHVKGLIRQLVHEIIRKKPGGGGYLLYAPNKGKKKSPKPVGEFPTRLAAKRAELARFPPKDTEQLKRARKRLDRLTKDPKKRADAERRERLGSSAPKSDSAPKSKAGKQKAPPAKKESVFDTMSTAIFQSIRESLFREEDLPGSPWDERLARIHPDAIASDKKLHGHHREIERASIGALGDAHKAMAKVLRGVAKVHPGDIGHDEQTRKRYMPVTLDVGGSEVGPIHLYVDGGNVRMELSPEAKEAIAGLEPPQARGLRGGLMTVEEDALPKIQSARKAWNERDAYLDKLHGKLDGQLGKMSPVELHLARQLMNTKHRGKR